MREIYKRGVQKPIDRVATRVIFQKGEFVPDRRFPFTFKTCPQTIPYTQYKGNNEGKDFTGAKPGRLTVIGYRGRGKQEFGTWVVRCACGNYELRKTKTIKKGLDGRLPDDCCAECDYTKKLGKKGEY